MNNYLLLFLGGGKSWVSDYFSRLGQAMGNDLKKDYKDVKKVATDWSKKGAEYYLKWLRSQGSTAYDLINLGLYIASLTPAAPVTLPLAHAMSVGAAVFAANDMLQEGATLDNVLDVIGGLSGNKWATKVIGKLAKSGLLKILASKGLGRKTSKAAKWGQYVNTNKGINLMKKPFWQVALENPKDYGKAGSVLYSPELIDAGSTVVELANDPWPWQDSELE